MPILANARHEKFAQLVVSGTPASVAHSQVGYGGSDKAHDANASRLIRDDKVASRIAELRAPALAIVQAEADEAVASAAWIISKAVALVEYGMALTPVMGPFGPILKDGEPVGYRMVDAKTATANLALLTKPHAEFSDKHDVNVDVTARIEALAAVAHLSQEQLAQMAQGARGNG